MTTHPAPCTSTPSTHSGGAGARTLGRRINAALGSCAATLWSELLAGLALAGQCAAGARCFPPDQPGTDQTSSRHVGPDPTEPFPDNSQQRQQRTA